MYRFYGTARFPISSCRGNTAARGCSRGSSLGADLGCSLPVRESGARQRRSAPLLSLVHMPHADPTVGALEQQVATMREAARLAQLIEEKDRLEREISAATVRASQQASPSPPSPSSPPSPHTPAGANPHSLEDALAVLELGEYLNAIREDGFGEAADLWELDEEDVSRSTKGFSSSVLSLTRLHGSAWLAGKGPRERPRNEARPQGEILPLGPREPRGGGGEAAGGGGGGAAAADSGRICHGGDFPRDRGAFVPSPGHAPRNGEGRGDGRRSSRCCHGRGTRERTGGSHDCSRAPSLGVTIANRSSSSSSSSSSSISSSSGRSRRRSAATTALVRAATVDTAAAVDAAVAVPGGAPVAAVRGGRGRVAVGGPAELDNHADVVVGARVHGPRAAAFPHAES